MSAARHSESRSWSRTGDIGRLVIGALIVLIIGYLGVLLAPAFGLYGFWPFAGIWAAIGWGAGRVSLKPVILLVATGLVTDLAIDAPLGCFTVIHLAAYLTASIFRKRAQTDRSGLVRLTGDLVALLVAFVAARWIIGAYLGGTAYHAVMGNFLTTALFYLPMRPFFLLKRDKWVDA